MKQRNQIKMYIFDDKNIYKVLRYEQSGNKFVVTIYKNGDMRIENSYSYDRDSDSSAFRVEGWRHSFEEQKELNKHIPAYCEFLEKINDFIETTWDDYYFKSHDDKKRKLTMEYGDNKNAFKTALYSKQDGVCTGCLVKFPQRNLAIDHIMPRNNGGLDNFENLQLLCSACNSVKSTGTQEQLIQRLIKQGVRKDNTHLGSETS